MVLSSIKLLLNLRKDETENLVLGVRRRNGS